MTLHFWEFRMRIQYTAVLIFFPYERFEINEIIIVYLPFKHFLMLKIKKTKRTL